VKTAVSLGRPVRAESPTERVLADLRARLSAYAALAKLRSELEGRAFADAPAPAAIAAATGAAEPAESPSAEAKSRNSHSGRLMLRMPQSLHAELAQAAEREEVSLNQFITNSLAASVGWHVEGGELPGASWQASPPRWLPAALVTNIVVVVIAGLIALALLVVALT